MPDYAVIYGIMLTTLVAYFATSSFIIPLFRKLALSMNWVDDPSVSSRKIHHKVIPYLGGVSVYSGYLFTIVIYAVFLGHVYTKIEFPSWFYAYMVGAALILVVGTLDDIYDVTALKKLLAQISISSLAYIGGIQLDHIIIPFVGLVELGQLSFPLTVFVITATMNAINIIDGMDGLAAGIVFIAVLANMFLALYLDLYFIALISLMLAACLFAFLRYNWNPARIFLGDGGSLLIGYLVVVIGIQNVQASNNFSNVVMPFLGLIYPVIDIMFAVVRRLMRGKPMMSADKSHIHHFLIDKGFSQKYAVGLILAFSLAMTIVGWFYVFDYSYVGSVLMFLVMGGAFTFFIITGYFKSSLLNSYLKNRPLLKSYNSYKDHVQVKIRYSKSQDELWKIMTRIAEEFNLKGITWVDSCGSCRDCGLDVDDRNDARNLEMKMSNGKIFFKTNDLCDDDVKYEIESLLRSIVKQMDKRIIKINRVK